MIDNDKENSDQERLRIKALDHFSPVACLSVSLIRVCQPRPVALKNSSTSASRRKETASLVWIANGRPRLAFVISAACPVSGSLAMAALIARSSASLGLISFFIVRYLSVVGFAETAVFHGRVSKETSLIIAILRDSKSILPIEPMESFVAFAFFFIPFKVHLFNVYTLYQPVNHYKEASL